MPISFPQSFPHAQVPSALNESIQGVAKGIPHMIVCIHNDRENLFVVAVYLVAVHLGFVDHVLASGMHYDFTESLQVSNSILHTARPLVSGGHIEALLLDVANSLRSGVISSHWPFSGAWN